MHRVSPQPSLRWPGVNSTSSKTKQVSRAGEFRPHTIGTLIGSTRSSTRACHIQCTSIVQVIDVASRRLVAFGTASLLACNAREIRVGSIKIGLSRTGVCVAAYIHVAIIGGNANCESVLDWIFKRRNMMNQAYQSKWWVLLARMRW